MDSSTDSLARAIGARVKHERRARTWTLDQLAAAAGVSRRMVVSVEQGAVNPSVGTLLRLSEALGVGLPSLVEPPAPRVTHVIRHGEGAVLWSGEHGGRGILVAGTEGPDVVELWEWTVLPGERHESEPHSPGTRELLQVQDGTVTIDVEGEAIDLSAGDALTFRGDVAHAYANPHARPVRLVLAVFEPRVGAAPRTETP